MDLPEKRKSIKAVVFDFGGVLAEEGFREGLKAIGRKKGYDPDDFFAISGELVYSTGYVTGTADESTFWNAVRGKTGIDGRDDEFREEILSRFVLRPEMIRYAERIKASGIVVAILSDQTNWLDELDRKTPFYHTFDYVFNSYRLKKGKRDPSVFRDLCPAMGVKPDEVVFVDDNKANIERASGEGLRTVHFTEVKEFRKMIEGYLSRDLKGS